MIVAIIQARIGSKRLPGKALKEVDGVPLLKYQIERVKKSRLLDRIVVATTRSDKDDVIDEFCRANHVECFRGPENDVLDRYFQCAKEYNADTIVRLTSDCPLSDPDIIDAVIAYFQKESADFAANTVPLETATFPDGSDVEVFSMAALERAHREAKDDSDREHVTFYFWKNNHGFKNVQLRKKEDWSHYRFTVDYAEDFEVVVFIMRELKKRNLFGHLDELIRIIDSNPQIKAKNARYYSGIGWESDKKHGEGN